jgi:hypothetical protein
VQNHPNPILPESQQQYRPQVPLQRHIGTEQQKNQNPLALPQQSLMSEMSREKTFTANNNENSLLMESNDDDDDDDDVVVGRMASTSQNRTIQKSNENLEQRNINQKESSIISSQNAHLVQQQSARDSNNRPAPMNEMRRKESFQSIPSRPSSGMENKNPLSPEPRQGLNGSHRSEVEPQRSNDNLRDTNGYDKNIKAMSNIHAQANQKQKVASSQPAIKQSQSHIEQKFSSNQDNVIKMQDNLQATKHNSMFERDFQRGELPKETKSYPNPDQYEERKKRVELNLKSIPPNLAGAKSMKQYYALI